MVIIKLLDKGPFYYHQHEKKLSCKIDEFGDYINEKPKKDWLLPYQPLYIITDEKWLIDRLKKYANDAFEKVDISSVKPFFCCSIPQEEYALCMPPKERYVENTLPDIPDDSYNYASDDHKIFFKTEEEEIYAYTKRGKNKRRYSQIRM